MGDVHIGSFSKENYIEVIYILSQEKEVVFNKDVVNYTGLSRPSVSVAVDNLIDDGLIYKEDRKIKPTEKGEDIGKKLYEKHIYFRDFLISIGVSRGVAVEEACAIEHIISNDTFEKIKEYVSGNK